MKKAIAVLATLLVSVPAFAQEAAAGVTSSAYYAIGAAIAISVAALGGALAQGKIGAAAMDGIARNPQAAKPMFVPMIICLVLIESLVIYALVIAFAVVGKL